MAIVQHGSSSLVVYSFLFCFVVYMKKHVGHRETVKTITIGKNVTAAFLLNHTPFIF